MSQVGVWVRGRTEQQPGRTTRCSIGVRQHRHSHLLIRIVVRRITTFRSTTNRTYDDRCRCRLGSRSRGYHPVAPRPISCRPFVLRHLVPPVISRGAPRHVTWETPISEERNYRREMAGQFDSDFHVNRRVLLHAANMRHGTGGFTSPLKEGMLWNFSPEKFGRDRTRDLGYQRPAC
jgi:hypothetical protein